MKLTIANPSKAYISATPEELDNLRQELTYTNTAIAYNVKRIYNNLWFRRNNPRQWQIAVDTMSAKVKRTLILEDDKGLYIRPGSIPYLTNPNIQIENLVVYPTPKAVPWKKTLPFQLHSYQLESATKLIEVRHGNVELTTGSGKSIILLKTCRETGYTTAIIAPSRSIFNELLEKFELHLGKGMVGTFGAGKKKLGKRFTICIGDSIANVKPGTEEWDFFSNLNAMYIDESHTWGAESLEEICYGVFTNVPIRNFYSGTQTRGDGTEKLLQSIIGKTVHKLTTKEAIEGGYICPHDYRIVKIESSNPNFNDSDVLQMKRAHFLKNRNICSFIAKLANAEAITRRRQTLVLVEELEQIAMLLPMLKVPTAIAHSEKKSDRLAELHIEKVDPTESVEQFNKSDALVLIGTSCISTGTNIYPTHNTINWAGGASEIRTKQGAVGRSVRLGTQNPWANRCVQKDKATIWDFDVYDCFIMHKHLEERISYYAESGAEIKIITLKK